MRLSIGVPFAGGALLGFVVITAVGDPTRTKTDPAVVAATPPVPTDGSPAPCDGAGRLEDLRAIESHLSKRIAELTAADAVARFLSPRDLPVRFSGPAVGAAVGAAFASSGVNGGVDDVDCSAYPCLVIGHYAGGNQIGRVQRALASNSAYSEDIAVIMAMGDDPSRRGTLFGAVVFPRGEPRAAEILAAFRRRRAEAAEKRAAAREAAAERRQ